MADTNEAAEVAAPTKTEIQVTEEVRFQELALVLRPGQTFRVSDVILNDPRLAGKIKE